MHNTWDELPPQGISELRPSYFELQAYVGATKHMGDLEATKEPPKIQLTME